LKLTFLVDVDIDHSDLETHANKQQRSEAAVVSEVVAELEERIRRALRGGAIIQVGVRALFESDRARKLVDA
jgi:hypothetical protein